MARNTDDHQVWVTSEADAPGWDAYGYDDAAALSPDDGGVATARRRRDRGRALQVAAVVVAVVGLTGLTAAACVLSYSSIRQLATQAGVSAGLASVYPLIFDALLVVTGGAVLALRGAGLVSRAYGWLCMLVLLGCLAAGGAIRAAAVDVPRHLGGVVAAIVPWALVLIGFGLLLTLLRYARTRRAHGAGRRTDDDGAAAVAPPGSVGEAAGITSQLPGSGEPNPGPGAQRAHASELNAAPTAEDEGNEVPPFRRTRSSPTPPGEQE